MPHPFQFQATPVATLEAILATWERHLGFLVSTGRDAARTREVRAAIESLRAVLAGVRS
jgi:hypothetical protein